MNNADRAVRLKTIRSLLERFRYRVDMASLLSDVFTLTACMISNTCDLVHKKDRQEMIAETLKRYNEDEQELMEKIFYEIFELCSECTLPDGEFEDWLGVLYMESETSNAKAGQFFTPFDLSRMCARIVGVESIERCKADGEVITVSEPACGSGGMILAYLDELKRAGINYAEKCFVEAADLDGRCAKMCYIQLSLAGVPAIVRQQNTLTMQQFDVWYTPAYIFNYMKFRRYDTWKPRSTK